jgi:hypothetical protein
MHTVQQQKTRYTVLRKHNMLTFVYSLKCGCFRDLCFVSKVRAELVHKVHLLCLLARGRIVDSACNDPLIQAALLSLLPSYLTKVSNLEKVTVKDIAPLLRWVWIYWHVAFVLF